ncbi:MAG: hypothetical protein GF370_04920 [Candidatus Nealsonbacteria bacterium]|nr:hypothetical protein [Candidatus Nealsonbacteria bacterium]
MRRSNFLEKYKNFKDPEEVQNERKKRIEEQETGNDQEWEKGMEKLKDYLEKVANKLTEDGFPVDGGAHVDSESDFFNDLYSKAERGQHEEKLEEFERKIFEEHGWRGEEDRMETRGEQLEMLKTALFDQFLGKSFHVLRTSKHDDYFNHLDNILVDKETGEMVCAFDEVSVLADSDPRIKKQRFREKENKVFNANASGGGKLDYAFQVVNEEGNKNIVPAKVENVPVFWIPLSGSTVEKAVRKFGSYEKQDIKYEKEVFDYLIRKIYEQARNLKNRRESPSDLEERSKSFLITKDWKKRFNVFYEHLEGEIVVE